jgi:uncharacterized protein
MTTTMNHPTAAPWHEGELAIQRSIGAAEHMDDIGRRWIRDHLPDQHRVFYPLLPYVALGAVAPDGEVWATLRAGPPGFMQSPDPYSLHISVPRDSSDPAEAGMTDGDAIGLLGIDLTTRRRNRLNGTVRRDSDDSFRIEVAQTYGNCPRYIQARDYAFTRDPSLPSSQKSHTSDGLDDKARQIISAADTFFVASYAHLDGRNQIDVSHRGGNSGFVHIDEDGVLAIPEFSGNRFFNTLGNFVLNPKAGLLFIDFATGDLLQIVGDAEVILDSPKIAAFQGAERMWRFWVRKTVRRPQGAPIRWTFDANGWSPSTLMTGNWNEAHPSHQP